MLGDTPPPPPPEQPPLTVEDIHRNQRANLALRALDLEAELVMLRQENERLQKEIAELKGKERVPARPNGKAQQHAAEPVP